MNTDNSHTKAEKKKKHVKKGSIDGTNVPKFNGLLGGDDDVLDQ